MAFQSAYTTTISQSSILFRRLCNYRALKPPICDNPIFFWHSLLQYDLSCRQTRPLSFCQTIEVSLPQNCAQRPTGLNTGWSAVSLFFPLSAFCPPHPFKGRGARDSPQHIHTTLTYGWENAAPLPAIGVGQLASSAHGSGITSGIWLPVIPINHLTV